MMMSEWIELVGHQPSSENWEAVDMVYTWHPVMPDATEAARKKCVKLLKENGYGIFHDMFPTAQRACEIDTEIKACTLDSVTVEGRYRQRLDEITRRRDEELALITHRLSILSESKRKLSEVYRHD